ncbi:MAG: HEAT repeat domain-containing protein [Roseiflexaceae bacterium]|nr:HEAT repeat domain-containing protein [Roseiflexaceae bacterium]
MAALNTMVTLLAAALLLACCLAPEARGLATPSDEPNATKPPEVARTPTPAQTKATNMPTPIALPKGLEAELATIQRDPGESIGFGEKAYLPYEPNEGMGLISSDDPIVTKRLLAELHDSGDRAYRLAVLHILGKRADATVDAALITTLGDPALRATSAYLLGRMGYRGYPTRQRDPQVVRAALQKWLDDTTTFDDPFYHRTYRNQDFVLAAYIRVSGPERFQGLNELQSDLIGYTLPKFTDQARTDLLNQAKQLP